IRKQLFFHASAYFYMLQKDENQLFVSSVCDTSVAFREVLSYLFNSSQTLSDRIGYFVCLRTRKGFSLRNSSGTSKVCAMVPGFAPRTRIRSLMEIASPMSCVTRTAVF